MNAPRTDVHAAGSQQFDPAQYTLVGLYYLGPSIEGMREEARFQVAVDKLTEQGYRRGGLGGGCGHCGANIMYVALMARADVHEWIVIGETCLTKRFSLELPAFRRLHARTAEARKEAKIVKAYRELCDQHPVIVYASYIDNISVAGLGDLRADLPATYDRDGAPMTFGTMSGKSWALTKVRQLHRSARRDGFLSDKQVAFLTKLMGELDEAHAALATREPEPEVPAIQAGRYEITGEIVHTKWQDNDFGGGSLKMLVVATNGQKFWGTAPASLPGDDDLKGRKVSLVGTVTRSEKDAGFGFYSRAAKARFID